jgi:hypothetical protein
LMWTDRIEGESCVVVSFADSVEVPHSSSDSEDEVVVSFAVSVDLLWTDRVDGQCCVVVVAVADSADEVVVPHNSSKSTSSSDNGNATLRVTFDDVIS